MKEKNLKPEDFAAEETKEDRSVSSNINVVYSENVKPGKNHLLHDVHSLQHKVNNLNNKKREKVIRTLQGETAEYFWTSINRHRKSSALRDSLRGVLEVQRRQD